MITEEEIDKEMDLILTKARTTKSQIWIDGYITALRWVKSKLRRKRVD